MAWIHPGSSDADIYKNGFHDRLSRYWPEPREQLHSGGWARTHEMVADIKRLMAGRPGGVSRVLDLCCGEGSTAAYLAASEGWEVTGVELVESAVMVARARAEQYGTFVGVKLELTPEPPAAPTAADAVADAVAFSVSYGTAVGVKLTPAAADEESEPVHCNLSYATSLGLKLSSSDDGDESPVTCKWTYDTSVGLKLEHNESDPVRCKLSYNPVVGGKLTPAQPAAAAAVPAVRLRLSYRSIPDLVRIAHASVHYMPLPSNAYDVVYGQDPDGLANEDRIYAFKEILRVLRPGGLFYFWHHWIPGPGWPQQLLQEYWTDPVTASPRLSYECYMEDLKAAGLEVVFSAPTSELTARHMGAMAAHMRREAPAGPGGSLPDKWLEKSLQFAAAAGGSMGIHVVAFKPLMPV